MTHTYVIPDCPYCGDEMKQIGYPPAPETITRRSPFGHRLYAYRCYTCAAESPKTERELALSKALEWAEQEIKNNEQNR